MQGEGYLPKIKRNIRDMRKNFATHAMNSMMKEIAHSNLTRELITKIPKNKNYLSNDVTELDATQQMIEAAMDYMPKKSNLNGQSSASPSSKSNLQLFGAQSKYTDCDGFNVHYFKNTDDCGIMSGRHDQLAVPVTCHKKTGKVYLGLIGESKIKLLFHELKVQYSEYAFLFESHYFSFLPPSDLAVMANEEEIDSWLCKDITSGILLQHKTRKNLYYCVRMDWKEMTVPLGSKQIQFHFPRLHKEICNDFQQI